jgi:hypothetical protein
MSESDKPKKPPIQEMRPTQRKGDELKNQQGGDYKKGYQEGYRDGAKDANKSNRGEKRRD